MVFSLTRVSPGENFLALLTAPRLTTSLGNLPLSASQIQRLSDDVQQPWGARRHRAGSQRHCDIRPSHGDHGKLRDCTSINALPYV